jgi:hypothetical protein
MKTTNLPSGAQRISNVGLVWEEVLTNAQGTIKVRPQGTFRVRAAGATTVTIAGTLAMTMSSGEIEYFNAGMGAPDDNTPWVEVVIGGAAAFVQVAKESDKSGRRSR